MSKINVKILFYKDDGESTIDKLVYGVIKRWTHGQYYHVEMVVDGVVIKSDRDGVSVGDADDPGSWDVVNLELDVNEHQLDVLHEWLQRVDGCRYDYMGIMFSQVIKSRYDDPDKWFCSELVVKALQILCYEPSIYLTPNTVSPNGLYNALKDNGDTDE